MLPDLSGAWEEGVNVKVFTQEAHGEQRSQKWRSHLNQLLLLAILRM